LRVCEPGKGTRRICKRLRSFPEDLDRSKEKVDQNGILLRLTVWSLIRSTLRPWLLGFWFLQSCKEEKVFMRSDLVFGALSYVKNRYQLCQLASKATRKLHKPSTRLQDTTNEVLGHFHQSNPMAEASAAVMSQRAAAQTSQRRAA